MDNYPLFSPDIDNHDQIDCKYSNVDIFKKYSSFLNIFMFNIRSVRKNFTQFVAYFSYMFSYFSFILLTETWLDSDFSDAFNIPGFYKYDLCRNNYGGGLRLFIRDGIKASLLSDFTFINDFMEVLTIECNSNSIKYIILLVYHSPTACHIINNMFIESLLTLLNQLKVKSLPIIIGGDMNLNLLNPYNFGYINTFINGMFESGFLPVINIPTKVNQENHATRYSIIDQFWVTTNLEVQNACVIPLDVTDHFPVGLSVGLHSPCILSDTRSSSRPLTDAGKISFRVFLSNVSLNNILGNHNLFMNTYMNIIMDLYSMAFPLKLSRQKPHNHAPWLTAKLKLCIRKKSKLYKSYLSGQTSRVVYIQFRNRVTSIIRRAKRLYYVKLFYHAGCSSRQIWSIIDKMIVRKRDKSLKHLEVNGTHITGLPLVNYVNHYFATAALTVTRGLQPPNVYPFLTPPVLNSFFFIPTTPDEVDKIIMKLKNKGSKIHDIHPSIIKENRDIFSYHITICYNASIIESIYPDVLKIGRVTPAHKSGPEDQVDNYRPISALPSISKIYESLTFNRMMSFITAHSIFSSVQFGFRVGRSTTQAVTKLLSYITKAYHNREYCVCFFLDLRKAFDTINHEIMLKKFSHYGFRGSSNDYLRSYFTNRKQCVCLKEVKSGLENIICGVPQGSILGPLCFNLYINDMPKAVSEECVLFADDAAFVISSTNLTDLYRRILKLFEDLSRYLEYNCLVPNASKSKLMFFSSRLVAELPDLAFSGRIIEWVSEFKYLGLILTNKLSFGKHIAKVALNVSRITGMLTSVRDVVPRNILLKMYYGLALPHINMHIEIWGAAPAYQLNMLEIKINNLLRIVFNIHKVNGIPVMGTREMYFTFNILRLESIFKLRLFKFLHALLNGRHPELFAVLLEPYLIPHNYGTRRGIFRHPDLTCEVERRFLSHQMIILYDQFQGEMFENSMTASLNIVQKFLFDSQ